MEGDYDSPDLFGLNSASEGESDPSIDSETVTNSKRRSMTYSTYRKALAEARKSGGKSKVRYILQTSDSSDDEGETLSHVSKKSKKTRSTSESDCRDNVTPTHFGKRNCYSEPNVRTEVQQENITPQRPRSDNNLDVCRELKKTSALMEEILQQMKKTESRVEAIEEKIDNTMSSSGSSSCSSVGKRKKKKDIPNTVKVTFCGMLCAYLNLV